MALEPLGRLESVPLREYWKDEARDFTPWLAQPDNLALLGEAIGLQISLESTELGVGRYSADIVCTYPGPDGIPQRLVIENQLEATDHSHLGQILTYVSGTEALCGVWIASKFQDEHRAAIEWLNESTDNYKSFWAIEIGLVRIGQSAPAPQFNVVVAPNPVTNASRSDTTELSDVRRDRLSFWEGFHGYLDARPTSWKVTAARPDTWVYNSIGRTGVQIAAVYTNYDLAEQRFVTGEIVTRVELVVNGPNAVNYASQIWSRQTEVEQSLSPDTIHWYSGAAKERKVFAQRIWTVEEAGTRDSLYKWIADEIQRFREVFLPIVQTLTALP